MDAATEEKWNRWCDDRIRSVFAKYDVALSEDLDEALSAIKKELRDEFNSAIGSLRADLTVQTAVAKGEIAEIKRSNVA